MLSKAPRGTTGLTMDSETQQEETIHSRDNSSSRTYHFGEGYRECSGESLYACHGRV